MEYLKYFREERNEMWELRKKIQEVWRGVFAAYRDVFITRTKKVPEVN